jgi:hypothetical protein
MYACSKKPQRFAWQLSGCESAAATRITGEDEALTVRSIVGVYFGQWTRMTSFLPVGFEYELKGACPLRQTMHQKIKSCRPPIPWRGPLHLSHSAAREDQFALLFVLGPVDLTSREALTKDIECAPPELTTAGRPIHHPNENGNET